MADVGYAPTEEQNLLRETARRFLAEQVGIEKVRETMMGDRGFDPDLWREIAELGWLGLTVSEEYGGAGYGFPEAAVLLEEMGRLVLPVPYAATLVFGATAISACGDADQRAAWLPRIVAGEEIVAGAVFDAPRGIDLAAVTAAARREGDEWVLEGTKRFVVDGPAATAFLVAAREAFGGLALFIVPADAVEVTPLPVLDLTRREADVALDGVRVPEAARLPGGDAEALRYLVDLAAVAVAQEQVGGAQVCLEMSVDYAKSRYQFGRPIGSFQAVKHRCADMLVKVEHARSAAYHAARVTEDPQEFAVAAPLAKSVASEAYLWVAGETIQVHGGIGFTWEHDAHLHLKRAKAASLLFGTPREHRHRLGAALGI